jgi:hypothetical protein
VGCRSGVEVSKRRVEAREAAVFLGFAWRRACRNCRSVAASRVKVDVQAVSKPTNFDARERSHLLGRGTRPLKGSLTPAERRWEVPLPAPSTRIAALPPSAIFCGTAPIR